MSNKFIVIHGAADSKEDALKLSGSALYKAGYVSKNFADLCIEREKEYPTGLPTEIPTAIPHCFDEGITDNCICFLKLDEPVAFRRMDDDTQEIHTRLIFNLAITDPAQHLKALQNLMVFLNDNDSLIKCETLSDDKLLDYLQEKIG